ncbi:acetyl-CoA synthetase-like protein [Mycena rosella]|uniref:Acetyl-CoA synthetase-like protein n=1 Tax=Mycena rosella TaxID=1033263 RepID=A0AAD7GDS5_MYCRO|nr:acetyl-CoA synthetase-like protein [Mycena rosella]
MSSTSSSTPTMLIPDAVALNSETNPSGPFYIYAEPESSEIVTITHLEFGRASQRAANLLRPNRQGPDGQVIALIALSDSVLYHATMVGLITANCIPFPISPRHSPTGIFQLLRTSSCHRILATCVTLAPLLAGLRKHVAEVDPEFVLNIEEIPSLAQIYPNLGAETPAYTFRPYPPQTSRPSLDDICIYVHSSGSTGLPKAIPQTHRALQQWSNLPAVAETRLYTEQPIANLALPGFHLFGIVCQLLQPLSGTCVAVYPPTATSPSALPITPSPENILENAQKTKCRSLSAVPSLLVVWFNSPAALAYLKTLHTIVWSGGPLPQRIGDALTDAGVHLLSGYGATEVGAISTVFQYEGDEKEWAWWRVSDLVKVRWVPHGSGTFHCHILTWEKHVPMVENLDDVRGYATSDICVNHPTKKHLWKVIGRLDDTIIHTSGENTVPAPLEDIIMSSPFVAGAVMFGSERPQTGILIETRPDLQIDVQNATQLADLRNKLWPIIEEANEIAPTFSRIFKEMILFTSREKPLPRAGKGTVMRKAAIQQYAPEIDAIYTAVEEKTTVIDSIEPPTVWEVAPIQEWLLKLAADLCNSTTVSPTENLRLQGFDSLTATIFRLHIMRALRFRNDAALTRAANALPQNLVYSFPTISQLSTYLTGLVGGTLMEEETAGAQMERLIAKYSPSTGRAQATAVTAGPAVVLLTGSTGNLGSRLLASLLKDDRARKIYALNRSSAGRTMSDRHFDIFNEMGLDKLLLASPKLVFIEGQVDQTNLGLKPDLYEEIRRSVTLIIHNAWTVDFNHPLASFEPHILGTRHLIDLALSSAHSPRFLFTSSVSSAQLWDYTRGPCPEDVLSETSLAMTGYGQSKYVIEQILAHSGLNATCLRVGQVCGALPKGAWPTRDWLPIIVKTCITLGCLPLANGIVSWIDFETVARAIIDVAFTPLQNSERLPSVLNLVHPRPVSWNFAMKSIRDALLKESNGSNDLRLVEFSNWYKELQAGEAGGAYAKESLPALKLLELVRYLANSSRGPSDSEFGGSNFSVAKMRAVSPAVDDVGSITEEQVKAWVNYWHTSGFI